jgi:hypothetical protein
MACVFLYWTKRKEHEHRFSHDTLASAIDDFFWQVEKNSTRQGGQRCPIWLNRS